MPGLVECPNCGAALADNFCQRCGQKNTPLDPTFREFLHELVHEIAHVDGKIIRSMRLLLARPGFLSREHFAGRRAAYVSPIRLYLTFSVLYFAVASFAPSQFIHIMRLQPLPGETAEALDARRHQIEETSNAIVTHWVPRAMFVDVPAFAALVALAARRSGRNYPQHLYFALHVHAAWFFLATIAAAARIAPAGIDKPIGALTTLYGIGYFVVAFRRTYDASIPRATISALVVGFFYLVVVLLTLFAIAMPVAVREGVLGR